MNEKIINKFLDGIKDGIPIALAYFSVSFTFGIIANEKGMPLWWSTIVSGTNLTSAGQFAGLTVATVGGSLIELALTTLIINLRYFLMSFAVTQKVPENYSTLKRMITAFGITDEIFAVICHREEKIGFKYYLGLLLLPYLGWTLGTFTGGFAGSVLPPDIRRALSVAIYGMFIAIIVPPARKNHKYYYAILIAVLISTSFKYIPFINKLSGGWVIIIATLVSSGVCAYFFPIKKQNDIE